MMKTEERKLTEQESGQWKNEERRRKLMTLKKWKAIEMIHLGQAMKKLMINDIEEENY